MRDNDDGEGEGEGQTRDFLISFKKIQVVDLAYCVDFLVTFCGQ